MFQLLIVAQSSKVWKVYGWEPWLIPLIICASLTLVFYRKYSNSKFISSISKPAVDKTSLFKRAFLISLILTLLFLGIFVNLVYS